MAEPTFVLKVSRHWFKMVKGRRKPAPPDVEETTIARSRVVLGSRPMSDIYAPDRLVPDEAIAFEFDGATLQIDVLKTLAGVFVDGRPVEGRGPVPPAAKIQVGHTLVVVAVDAAARTCKLDVSVNYLQKFVYEYADKKKVEPAFGLHDSGPQEHRWGKSAVLVRSSAFAAAAGLVLLGSFPFLTNSEAMSRGDLFHAHAIGAKDGPKDCAACHAPLSSNYTPQCAACHPGLDGTKTHPYDKNAELSCAECHAEHVGASADIVPPMKASASGWPATCERCHAGQPYPSAEAAAAFVPKARENLRDSRGEPLARQLLVDGFSHADHRIAKPGGIAAAPGDAPKKGQVPVACSACHQPLAKTETHPAIATAEFAPVRYEQCLECHADWRVDVHGRDDGGAACYACHAQTDSPLTITAALKTVELPATEAKWVLKPRGHDFKKDECLACHVLEKSSKDHRTSVEEKVFRHDHHLDTVTPAAGRGMKYSEQCRSCHETVAGSATLAGTKLVNTESCARCHTDSEPVPVPVEEGATRRVGDMVHSRHTADAAALSRSALRYTSRDTLADGCLSCHTPAAGVAPMGLKSGANDCKACHTGHENLGDGKCVLCHVDRTPGANRIQNGRLEFLRSEPGIFNPAKATSKTAAAQAKFDHGSAGHANHDCAACHEPGGVDGATRVLDVPWPAHDEASCVKCHVRQRFHR